MGKYNLTEKKEKNAAYRSLVRAELVDELYEKILKVFVVDKKYRGSLARCIPAYTHDLHDDLLRARPERVFITHSGSISASIRTTPVWSMSTASKTPSIS